jgi:hypothetical protein
MVRRLGVLTSIDAWWFRTIGDLETIGFIGPIQPCTIAVAQDSGYVHMYKSRMPAPSLSRQGGNESGREGEQDFSPLVPQISHQEM